MPANASPSPAEIVAAMQRGGIVEALKLVLASKGATSSAAKKVAGQVGDRFKAFEASPLSTERTDLSPGEVPRSSVDVSLLLVLIAVLCAIYYVYAR